MDALDVTVVIHKADDLVSPRKSPNQSWSVVMKMEKQKFRTKQVKFTDSPIWQEVAIFKSAKLKPTATLYLVVTDKEEVVGQICIPYTQIGLKPGSPTILQAALAPHKKCPKPLGGSLFYEVWRSEAGEPELPRTRVITGDDYFAAHERSCATLPSRHQSFKKSSILNLFSGSTTNLSHGISPSVANLSTNSKKSNEWTKGTNKFSSCNDLSAFGAGTDKNKKKSATLGGRIRSSVKRLSSIATTSRDSNMDSTEKDEKRRISITSGSDKRTSITSTSLAVPSFFVEEKNEDIEADEDFHSRSSTAGSKLSLQVDRFPNKSSRDNLSRDNLYGESVGSKAALDRSSSSCDSSKDSPDEGGVGKRRRTPDGTRFPDPPVTASRQQPSVHDGSGFANLPVSSSRRPMSTLNLSDSKPSALHSTPTSPVKLGNPENGVPTSLGTNEAFNRDVHRKYASSTSLLTSKMERIIQGSENVDVKELVNAEGKTTLTGNCSVSSTNPETSASSSSTVKCSSCAFKTAERDAAAEEVQSFVNEITDLRVRVHDLEETNASLRRYLDSVVGDVMEFCPWILEKNSGGPGGAGGSGGGSGYSGVSGGTNKIAVKSGNTFVSRGGKYATIGPGSVSKNGLNNPYQKEGFNMAKKLSGRPGPLIRVPSLSKIFRGSKMNLNK